MRPEFHQKAHPESAQSLYLKRLFVLLFFITTLGIPSYVALHVLQEAAQVIEMCNTTKQIKTSVDQLGNTRTEMHQYCYKLYNNMFGVAYTRLNTRVSGPTHHSDDDAQTFAGFLHDKDRKQFDLGIRTKQDLSGSSTSVVVLENGKKDEHLAAMIQMIAQQLNLVIHKLTP